jgi:hypothetical protein
MRATSFIPAGKFGSLKLTVRHDCLLSVGLLRADGTIAVNWFNVIGTLNVFVNSNLNRKRTRRFFVASLNLNYYYWHCFGSRKIASDRLSVRDNYRG